MEVVFELLSLIKKMFNNSILSRVSIFLQVKVRVFCSWSNKQNGYQFSSF